MRDILNNNEITIGATSAYNDRKLLKFDATFGDGGCQGRAMIILPLIQEYPTFQELPADKKEFLKLCFILQQKVVDKLDEIGILATEEYVEIPLLSDLKNKARDKVVKEMSKRLGQLTIDFVSERANQAELKLLLAQLNPKTTARDIPTASTPIEANMALQLCINRNIPILLKIKRMEYQTATQTFLCEFVELLQLNYTGVRNIGVKTPSLVVESYSLKSDVDSDKLMPEMRELNNSKGFDEYIDKLNTFGLFKAIELNAQVYDVERGYSVSLNGTKNPLDFNCNYATRSGMRNTSCSPFVIQHFYPSTVEAEIIDLNRYSQCVGRVFQSQCALMDRS